MRQQGSVVEWNDERGFGFLTRPEGRSKVFAHISAFPRGHRPVVGDAVTWVVQRDEHGRSRAVDIWFAGARRRSPASSPLTSRLVAVTLFAAVLAGLIVGGHLPVLALAPYAVLSPVSLALYGSDKAAARRRDRRVPESTLHLVDLLGGWPGGLVARRAFRHKTVKQPFRTVFWFTVVLNCAALAGLALAPGA